MRSSLPRSPGQSGPGRILLADGDVGVQATLAVTLQGEFLLADACNVADALYLLTEAPPDMLILSARQPDLDAGYLLRAVRAQAPGCPVLLVTDAQHADVARTLLVHGINGYFLKPLPFDRLLERITALLRSPRQRGFAVRGLSAPVSRAIQHLSCQQARIPTVRELAMLSGVPVGQFSHAFSLDTGMPPKEYLTRVRIELAKRLLNRTSGNLEAIASTLGFWDASHLSRIFRARTGEAPGRFRRRLRRAG